MFVCKIDVLPYRYEDEYIRQSYLDQPSDTSTVHWFVWLDDGLLLVQLYIFQPIKMKNYQLSIRDSIAQNFTQTSMSTSRERGITTLIRIYQYWIFHHTWF